MDVVKDVGRFFNKVNERALYNMGVLESYDSGGDDALGETVEYFHPQITLDDRMRYIMENIVYAPISMDNIICNTIISHFYGARGIHQVLTRDPNPKTALVDFERLLVDREYEDKIRKNLEDAVSLGLPIYGSTELRTSLFGAANNYVAQLRNQPRDAHKINILLWVASFIPRGITGRMAQVKSLSEMYDIISSLEGVGQYYGYLAQQFNLNWLETISSDLKIQEISSKISHSSLTSIFKHIEIVGFASTSGANNMEHGELFFTLK